MGVSRALQRTLATQTHLFSPSTHTKAFAMTLSTPFSSDNTEINPSAATGSAAFLDAAKGRRSVYGISDSSPIPDSKIIDIVSTAIKYSPTTFNNQASRAVVLFGDRHRKLWDIVHEFTVPTLPEQMRDYFSGRLKGFGKGHGTVVFLEDSEVVQASQKAQPAWAAAFPIFSGNSAGMFQLLVWTALELEGLGGSLQHNGLLEAPLAEALAKEFGWPSTWKISAEIPFGKPEGGIKDKTFLPLEDRVRVLG